MINQQSFSDLLGDIYSSASDFSNWQQVLRRVADVFGGNCSVLGVTDKKQHFSAYVAPLTDPAFVTSYNAHYHAISPLMPRIRALPTGSVVTDRMVLPRREFVRSDIYNEWILPQGIKNKLYTVVLSEPSRRVILGVHSEREFDDEQIRFCQLLTPHLQRAMQLSLSFLHVDMVQATAMQALDRLQEGVLVVGERSEIIFMNRAAEALFEPGGGLRLDGGRLTTSNPRQAAELRQLLSRCQSRRSDGESGGSLTVSGPDQGRPLSVIVVPISARGGSVLQERAAALLFVKFPSQGPKLTTAFLVERFGLTPAEAAFAQQVCEGRGLAAAAERQGIRLSTARTHLARIFDKTGTRRQAELVRLLLESEGPARGDDEEVGSLGGQSPSVAEAARSRRPLNGAAEKMPSIV